jgi:hypothetical protein
VGDVEIHVFDNKPAVGVLQSKAIFWTGSKVGDRVLAWYKFSF